MSDVGAAERIGERTRVRLVPRAIVRNHHRSERTMLAAHVAGLQTQSAVHCL
ncbi:MAG: hypothetical protein WB609_02770 [Candidatus Cybelea sp.]